MPVKVYNWGSNISEIAKAIPAAIEGFNDAEDRRIRRQELVAKLAAQKKEEDYKMATRGLEGQGVVTDPSQRAQLDAKFVEMLKGGYNVQVVNQMRNKYLGTGSLQSQIDQFGQPQGPQQEEMQMGGMPAAGNLQPMGPGQLGAGNLGPMAVTGASVLSPEAQEEKNVERQAKQIAAAKSNLELKEKAQGSDTERKTAGFAKRLEQSENELNNLLNPKEGEGYDPTGIGEYIRGKLPEMFKGENLKKLNQLKTNFINAALRRESGSAISSSELDSANLQYFPMVNDTDEVLAQKARNRATVMENLKGEAGIAYKPYVIPKEVKKEIPGKKLEGYKPTRKKNLEDMSQEELDAYESSLGGE